MEFLSAPLRLMAEKSLEPATTGPPNCKLNFLQQCFNKNYQEFHSNYSIYLILIIYFLNQYLNFKYS